MLPLFVIILILGLIFQKAKPITILQVLFCAIVFSFNIDNPDYTGYLGTYNSVSIGGAYLQYFNAYGYLYRYICRVFSIFGLSFNQFRFLVFVLCMALILSSVKKITARTNMVLSLYMIFPFVMDCIQIRNFIAEAIIIFSVKFLIRSDDEINKKKNVIKFIICVIVATLFHRVSIFYLLFLAQFFKNNFKRIFRLEFIGMSLISLTLTRITIPGITDRSYLTSRVSMLTMVFLSSITILLILALHYYAKNKNVGGYLDETIAKQLYYFALNCATFFPLLVFHYDMFRFIRNVLIVFSAFAGYYVQSIQTEFSKKHIVLMPTITVVTIFVLLYGLLLYRSAYYALDISLLDQILNSIVLKW